MTRPPRGRITSKAFSRTLLAGVPILQRSNAVTALADLAKAGIPTEQSFETTATALSALLGTSTRSPERPRHHIRGASGSEFQQLSPSRSMRYPTSSSHQNSPESLRQSEMSAGAISRREFSDFLEGLPRVNLQLDSSQYVSALLGPSLELLKQLGPNIAAETLKEIGEKMGVLMRETFLQVFPTMVTDLNERLVIMLPPTIEFLMKRESPALAIEMDALLGPKLTAFILTEISKITTALEKSLAPKINFSIESVT